MLHLCAILGILCFTPAQKLPPEENEQIVAQTDEIELAKRDHDGHSKKKDKKHDKHDKKHHKHDRKHDRRRHDKHDRKHDRKKHKYHVSYEDRYEEETVN